MFVCHKNITVNATFCAQAAVCFHYVINQTHQKPMFFCSLLAKSDPTLLWPLSSIPNKPYGFCGHQAPCLLTRCGPRSSKIKTKSTSFVQVLTELNVLYQYHKQGLHVCQMYQTPGTMFFTLHWQKVTHHGCDLSSSNSKKKKEEDLFCTNVKRKLHQHTLPGADLLSSQHPIAKLFDSRAVVGWHALHGVLHCGPCPHWSGGGGKRHTQTWRSWLQCWSRCCVATICWKISLLLISAPVLAYIDVGVRDSAKGCGVQVHRQQQFCPWR